MRITNRGIIVAAIIGAGVLGFLWMRGFQKPVGIARSVIDGMTFPKGVDEMVGEPDTGVLTHMVVKRSSRGSPDIVLGCVPIPDRDFRRATAAEKQDWLKKHATDMVEASGLLASCQPPDDPFLGSAAYAQPQCEDCGGSCFSWTCSATRSGATCLLGGGSCAVTFICCGSCNIAC